MPKAQKFDLERFQEEDFLKRDLLDWWVKWGRCSCSAAEGYPEATLEEDKLLDELAKRVLRRMDQRELRARLEG